MKVLFYGHSYVRDLQEKCNWRDPIVVNGREVQVNYLFRYFPGKDYEFLLNKPQEFDILENINPDYIVVVLGGNSIVASNTNGDVNSLANAFYEKLRSSLPHTVVIAAQIEPRYNLEGNIHGAPTAEEYNRRRVILNNFVNKKLKKRGLVNYIAVLGSAAVYDKESFRDGIHLLDQPLFEYQRNLLNALVYAAEAQ